MSLDVKCDCDECGNDIGDGDSCYCKSCYKEKMKLVEGISAVDDIRKLIDALEQVIVNLKQERR